MTEHPRDEADPGGLAPGDEAPPGTPGAGEDVCPVCGGTGEQDGRACLQCDGRGTVIEGVGGG